MPRLRRLPIRDIMFLFMALILIIVVWAVVEPGGWPVDFRVFMTFGIFGILVGATSRD